MSTAKRDYHKIFKHYESTLEKYGANSRGMDWPNEQDVAKRFKIMSELGQHKKDGQSSLLDLGCGVGLFSEYLAKNYPNQYDYFGVDISEKMILAGKDLFPQLKLEQRDILEHSFKENEFDFVVMNGVLTEKVSLSKDAMVAFAQKIISEAFNTAKVGIAFNTMSSHVDWEREDLFHWPLDEVVQFLVHQCSRNIRIRMDYGLYEYTVYVFKDAVV